MTVLASAGVSTPDVVDPTAPAPSDSPAPRSVLASVWRHDGWVLSMIVLFIGASLAIGPLVGWAGAGWTV